MFGTTSPGRFRLGLIIFILLLLGAAGCAVRHNSFTSPPSSTVVPRHTEPAPAADTGDKMIKKAEKEKEADAGETGMESPPALSVPDSPAPPAASGHTTKVELMQGSSGSGMIALTFDAGASPKPTPSILRTLKHYGVHSTFFLTGRWMESNPGLTREIAEDGHEISNHSYSHPDFTKLDDTHIHEQLEKTEQIAEDTAGISTKPFFRPPYGARNTHVRTVAAEEGYQSVFWSVDSWDAFKKGITPAEIKDRVLSKAKGGSIVLMHCGSAATAEALPSIIEELRARGYRLVTVSELAGSR